MAGALATLRTWGRMVRFSHSAFALPFAFSGAALAAADHGIRLRQVVWITVAMVAVRNAAMGFNRLADHALDARNPRTVNRELPRGVLSRRAVWGFTVALSALFVAAAFQLNPLCGALSPVALAVVAGYSYTKRFTWATHLILGLGLSMAPVGAWLAVRGAFAVVAWLLGAAVLFWVGGFDVIYACQDVGFDRAQGLHSIPARFGVARALLLARVFHALSVAAMVLVGIEAGLHPFYWAGVGVIALLLAWEHRLVRADDLTRAGVAFFHLNAVVSAVYLLSILGALWAGRGPR